MPATPPLLPSAAASLQRHEGVRLRLHHRHPRDGLDLLQEVLLGGELLVRPRAELSLLRAAGVAGEGVAECFWAF